ncbi:hypothetical protein FRB90_007565 [Tulasnella sp. 427]|nr:hypothetical protein FRB90_007565 [Tulasnella sp. 427]
MQSTSPVLPSSSRTIPSATIHGLPVELLVRIFESGYFDQPTGSESPSMSMWKFLMDKGSPILETLVICDPLAESLEPTDLRALAPQDIFSGVSSVPNVKTLRLVGIPITWATCPFRGLRQLELSDFVNGQRPSVDQFRDLLIGSPSLETLSLRGRQVKANRLRAVLRSSSPPPPIHLPCLTSISLSKFKICGTACDVLALMDAPNLAHLEIAEGFCGDREDDAYDELFDRMAQMDDRLTYIRNIDSLKLDRVTFDIGEVVAAMWFRLQKLHKLSIIAFHLPLNPRLARSTTLRWFLGFMLREPLYNHPPIACSALQELHVVNLDEQVMNQARERRKKFGVPLIKLQQEQSVFSEEDEESFDSDSWAESDYGSDYDVENANGEGPPESFWDNFDAQLSTVLDMHA